jgi:hypothetical protein
MKMTEVNASPGSVEDVFAAHCDQQVREDSCRATGARSWAVEIVRDGDRARIQVDREMPPEVPDFVRRFLGDAVHVRQFEQWSGPDSDGVRRADVKVTIQGQPASMVGSAVLRPVGQGSEERVEGEVKVAIPILGRRVEPEIAKVIASAIRVEQRIIGEWIAARS